MSWQKWFLAFFALSIQAGAVESYYGKDLASGIPPGDSAQIKERLFKILSQVHVVQNGKPDEIVSNCPAGKTCIVHNALGYDRARKLLFGRLYLKQIEGQFALRDVYCNKFLTNQDFPKGNGIGPDKIPDPRVLNAEHSWPQSRFSRKFSTNLQKSDIHILFPVSSEANSLRGNYPYGDVVTVRGQACRDSALGFLSRGNNEHFLPPPDVRGDVARALFYFSVRYQMPLDPSQEESLKHWSQQDPVDNEERQRHEEKAKLQGDRNPFIDHPEWVDAISDF